MPASKHAYTRYTIINKCLASKTKPYWSKQELLHKLANHDINISERTLEHDLEVMRHDEQVGFKAPIDFCQRNRGYHYTDRNYTTGKLTLAEEEVQCLLAGVAYVEQNTELEILKHFKEIIYKLVRITDNTRQTAQAFVNPVIEFSQTSTTDTIAFLDTLFKAITEMKVLKVKCKRAPGTRNTEFVFHPYRLKKIGEQWYAIGYHHTRNTLAILRLNAIHNIIEIPNHRYLHIPPANHTIPLIQN